MKTDRLRNTLSMCFFVISIASFGQYDRVDVPGDHFSLEGALELFKKSSSPEEFEQLLNSRDSKVNNLDLNGDGFVDYIRVVDRHEGNVHAFILQAMIDEAEYQDVAVIELEKLDNGKAVLQITGDEDVYGIETIIEPTEEVRVYAGATTVRTTVNVWTWPAVRYVYSPAYTVWVSPWRWSYRPVWWRTWRPVAYYVYDPWWQPYRPYYSVCHTHRIVYARQIYRPYRTTSVIVYNRHHTQINRYRSTYHDHSGRDRRDHGRNRYEASHPNGRQHTGARGSHQPEYNYRNSNREYNSTDRGPSGALSVPQHNTQITQRGYSVQPYTQQNRTRTHDRQDNTSDDGVYTKRRSSTSQEFVAPQRPNTVERRTFTQQNSFSGSQRHSLPEKRVGTSDHNQGSHQQVFQGSNPPDRRSSSGSSTFKRTADRQGNGEKSPEQFKRGRQ